MMRNEVIFLYEIGFKDLILLKSTKGEEFDLKDVINANAISRIKLDIT